MERKEAMEIVRKLYKDSLFLKKDKEAIVTLIPELKESESEDERIRKEILSFLKEGKPYYGPNSAKRQEWAAWFENKKEEEPSIADIVDEHYWEMLGDEKQGAQKPSDKVEPKFKVDDWIINTITNEIEQIIELTDYEYICSGHLIISFNNQHLLKRWTIEDAKDGDVLYMDNGLSTCTFIYKSIDSVIIQKYASYNKFGFEGTTYLVLNDGYVCPATKEQRDLLFQKMKEAGYEWNVEKKELKKIEQEPYPETLDKAIDLYYYTYGNGKGGFDHLSLEKFKGIVKMFVDDYGMQNHAWSEEDDAIRNDLINYFRGSALETPEKEVIDFLKSLKERVLPQPKQEWSEDDEKGLSDALWAVEQARTIAKDENDMGNIWYAENWLKSLKERIGE